MTSPSKLPGVILKYGAVWTPCDMMDNYLTEFREGGLDERLA